MKGTPFDIPPVNVKLGAPVAEIATVFPGQIALEAVFTTVKLGTDELTEIVTIELEIQPKEFVPLTV